MIKDNKWIYYSLLGVIIVASFFLHSSYFYPILNSDDALNVLMAYSYKLPNDFYCWGQDRGGTLIPLIAQLFLKLFGLSPILSISFANYTVLIAGYLAFSSFFKNNFTKLLLAIAWFFPPMPYADLTRFPIGVQYSLIAVALYLINKIDFKEKRIRNHLFTLGIIILFTTAIWVSSFAVVTIIITILVYYLFYIRKTKKILPPKATIFYSIFGVLASYTFIHYAKSFASKGWFNYFSVNTPRVFWQATTSIAERMWLHLSFQAEKPLLSLSYCLALLLFITLIIALLNKKISLSESSRRYLMILSIDFVMMFGGILMSRWTYANFIGYWYFVTTYISAVLILLLLFDNLQIKKRLSCLIHFLALSVMLTSGASTIQALQRGYAQTLRSQVSVRSELLSLGENIGIIADYWNAYISAVPNPDRIKATPRENGGARNDKLIYEVFEQPKLFVIRDGWMDTFPDTLRQYGFLLKKKGDPLFLANRNVQEYVRLKRDETIPLDSMIFTKEQLPENTFAIITTDSIVLHDSIGIAGPKIPIAPGQFTVEYEVEFKQKEASNKVALFEVTTQSGEEVLSRYVYMYNQENSGKQIITLNFTTTRSYNDLETKIYPEKGVTVIVTNIRLIEK